MLTKAAEAWIWDDKTNGSYGPYNSNYRVANFNQGGFMTPNLVNFSHLIPLTAVGKVTQPPKAGQPPEMHTNPHYYYLDAGATTLGPIYATVFVHWNIGIPGGTNKVQVGADSGAGTVYGGLQGPWK